VGVLKGLALLGALLSTPSGAQGPASEALLLAAGASWDGKPAAADVALAPPPAAWGELTPEPAAGPPATGSGVSTERRLPAGPVVGHLFPAAPGGSGFEDLWAVLKAEPLAPASFPRVRVTLWSFFSGFAFRLLDSARRTLDDERDLLPDFDKLIRPNGIALAGTWEATEENPYTGCFRQGSRARVIARASVFSDEVGPGGLRSFGLALKLFPEEGGRTANVFLIDDNGGTPAPHFTDAVLVTKPKLSFAWSLLWRMPALALVSLAQRLADAEPGYRQLYPVAELGEEELGAARSPGRLLVRAAPSTPRVESSDFRQELDAANYPGGLVFDVFAGEGPEPPESGDPGWLRIGRLVFTESVVSRAVDHNLHFQHPRNRPAQQAGDPAVYQRRPAP